MTRGVQDWAGGVVGLPAVVRRRASLQVEEAYDQVVHRVELSAPAHPSVRGRKGAVSVAFQPASLRFGPRLALSLASSRSQVSSILGEPTRHDGEDGWLYDLPAACGPVYQYGVYFTGPRMRMVVIAAHHPIQGGQ